MDSTIGTQSATSSPAQNDSDVDTSQSSAATNTTDVNRESSPGGVKQPTSIREALAKVKPETAEEAAGEDGPAGNSPLHEEGQAGEAGSDAPAGEQNGQPAGKDKADGSLNVPYGERAEWKGLLALVGDERKSDAIKILRPVFEQAQALERQIRTIRPTLEIVDELRQHTGDAQGFETMRGIVRTYATEPEKAIPVLENMLKDARERAGLEITSPDLKERLAEIDDKQRRGLLDAAEAEAWKADLTAAEQARAGGRQAQARLQATQQRTEQEQAAEAQSATINKLNSWEENIRKRDPDFGQVTDPDDPEHGASIADQVYDAIVLKQTHNPRATVEELLKEADRAYKLARGRLSNGRGRQQRVLTSEGSFTTARPEAKTMREALNRVPRERA